MLFKIIDLKTGNNNNIEGTIIESNNNYAVVCCFESEPKIYYKGYSSLIKWGTCR